MKIKTTEQIRKLNHLWNQNRWTEVDDIIKFLDDNNENCDSGTIGLLRENLNSLSPDLKNEVKNENKN